MTDIVCNICEKKFKGPQGLGNHMKWKHGVRSKKKPVLETNSEPSLSEIILMMEVKRDSLNEFIEHLRSLKK